MAWFIRWLMAQECVYSTYIRQQDMRVLVIYYLRTMIRILSETTRPPPLTDAATLPANTSLLNDRKQIAIECAGYVFSIVLELMTAYNSPDMELRNWWCLWAGSIHEANKIVSLIQELQSLIENHPVLQYPLSMLHDQLMYSMKTDYSIGKLLFSSVMFPVRERSFFFPFFQNACQNCKTMSTGVWLSATC